MSLERFFRPRWWPDCPPMHVLVLTLAGALLFWPAIIACLIGLAELTRHLTG